MAREWSDEAERGGRRLCEAAQADERRQAAQHFTDDPSKAPRRIKPWDQRSADEKRPFVNDWLGLQRRSPDWYDHRN